MGKIGSKKRCVDCGVICHPEAVRCRSCSQKNRFSKKENHPRYNHHLNNDIKKKISDSLKGEKHPNWKGGITPLNKKLRNEEKYKQWRSQVFERDNWTCVWCGKKGNLEADHIKPLSLLLKQNNIKIIEEAIQCKELWDINNGRTLCKDCHKETKTYGFKCLEYEEENKIIFNLVHSDDRREIYSNTDLLNGKEVSIIKLNGGKAIGGCIHSKDEGFATLEGIGFIEYMGGEGCFYKPKLLGVFNTKSGNFCSGTISEGTPHAFFAEENSIIIEWGLTPEEKKNSLKDKELLGEVDEFNERK